MAVPHRPLWPGLLAWSIASTAAGSPVSDPGEYISRIAGCGICHTDSQNQGAPLAGGRALVSPFGTFYTPNITPDPDTGIGSWNQADFERAVREGVAPGGHSYFPAFPYTAYAGMSEQDMAYLWRYLSSRKPVRKRNREHDLNWLLQLPGAAWLWKWLNFSPPAVAAPATRQTLRERGAYLVRVLGHCGECHTPRNALGAKLDGFDLAGSSKGLEGERVPNITPDKGTGIGRWKTDDLNYFLATGALPGGDYVGGSMAEIIDAGLQYLQRGDREAMAHYLFSLEPVVHAVGKKNVPAKRRGRGEFD